MAKETKKRMLPEYKVVELKASEYVEDIETYTDANGNKQSRTIVTWLNDDGTFSAASGKIHTIAGRTVLRVTEWREV